jgi:hypothetical protein
MRMVSARLRGYRRFEEETTLDLTPRVIAIVGPNEAGKSSLLDGLEVLTTPGEVVFDERDFSGWSRPPGEREVLSALFVPESEDRDALSHIPGAEKVRLWELSRRADGSAHARVIPELHHDPAPREKVARGIERMLRRDLRPLQDFLDRRPSEPIDEPEETGPPGEGHGEQEPPEPTVRELAETALVDLNDAGDLSTSACETLEALALALEGLPQASPAYVHDLLHSCAELAAEHRKGSPNDRAFAVLDERCPRVKVLRDADRQLQTGYRFEEFEQPPAPLENLLALAGVKWAQIKNAVARPENPKLETLLGRANRRLEERLRGSWRQSTVSVQLAVQNGQLNVYPYDAESDQHTKIEERSDGFKSFLALLAFTTRHSEGDRKLVLGIDEAELHLHYDAQVDLVGVLTRYTNFATQIVYTTHSAGCLPEDLGSGIRVVKECRRDRSEIANGFWSAQDDPEESVAFTSLLMAMGASAVAFTPARHAVITEGPSDALLLPALLREALGVDSDRPLGFQVSGGLAWTPPRLLPRLEAEASHVVYLTDSDGAGERYRAALKEAGVVDERLFELQSGRARGLSVEDFVEEGAYVEVVNLLLREMRGQEGDPFRRSDVPAAGAAAATEAWALRRGLRPLPKPAIAEHLLSLCGASLAYAYWAPDDEVETRHLLRQGRRESLVRLHSLMRNALRLPDSVEAR